MPTSIAIPLDGMLVHRRFTLQQNVAGTHLYTRVKRKKWSKVPCLRKQRDGPGLNATPPDPEFELLTAQPQTPQKEPL